MPSVAQAGPPVYKDNDLDRGHLVMRASSAWGDTEEEARRAEAETFYFTDATPQAALFNQGHELWLGLEDYLLEDAATFDRKLVVFAGPVLGCSWVHWRTSSSGGDGGLVRQVATCLW